jgi:hypothetical protein
LVPLTAQQMPAGFEIAANFAKTSLAPGKSTTFALRMTAAAVATPDGTISIYSSDGKTVPFDLELKGTVSAVRVLDDGDAGFKTTGTWTVTTGLGYQNDCRTNTKGTGRDTASWTFAVVPGWYRVAVTWPAGVAGAATDAPFSVYGGTKLLGTVMLDQQADLGGGWKNLEYQGNGGVFQITGTSLVVKLTDKASGNVIADAVRIERVEAPALRAAASLSAAWHNPDMPCDVNGNGRVEPLDALIAITYLSGHPGETSLPARPAGERPYYDVNNDGVCSAVDVLIVTNWINDHAVGAGEGESVPNAVAPSATRTIPTRFDTDPLKLDSLLLEAGVRRLLAVADVDAVLAAW